MSLPGGLARARRRGLREADSDVNPRRTSRLDHLVDPAGHGTEIITRPYGSHVQ
jgi:hypothetical protein